MKLHIYIFQIIIAFLMIIVFPVYFANSAEITAPSAASTSDAQIIQVDIIKYKFTPQEITIKAGSTVRWTNREKRQYHSVWFELLGEPEPEYFFPDESFERTFPTTGTFPYRCGPHPEMTGVVHVK